MREKITEIILECGIDKEDVYCKDYIVNGILDSLKMLDIISSLEENFGIEIDGDDIIPENFQNLDTIVSLLKNIKQE
jgi:acyl carrier protein